MKISNILALAFGLASVSAQAAEHFYMRVPAPAKCAGISCTMKTVLPAGATPGAPVPESEPGGTITAVTAANFDTLNLGMSQTLAFTFQSNGVALPTLNATLTGPGMSFTPTPSQNTCGSNGRTASLPAGPATCKITVRFQPTVLGPAAGVISLTTPTKEIARLQVNGAGGAGRAVYSTDNVTGLQFGNVAVGTTQTRTVTLTNVGDAALLMGAAMFSGEKPSGSAWSAADNCGGTRAPGSVCTFTIQVTPTAPGTQTYSYFIGTNPGPSMFVPLTVTAF